MLKQFFSLLKRYILPYRKYLTWALILNFLSQWLNVFSFMAIVPILNILFKIDTKSYEYIPMDIHNLPERYIRDFVECGADSITVHAEACEDLERTLEQIKAAGVKAAVSIKPSTPVNDISHLLEDVDMVLVMTVQPGFGGQKYMDECTEKIQELRELIDEEDLDVDIQVDGGINDDTLETVMRAGANFMVAGSWVFKGDVAANVRHITDRIHDIKEKLD